MKVNSNGLLKRRRKKNRETAGRMFLSAVTVAVNLTYPVLD